MWLDRNASDPPIRTDLLRPNDRSVLDRHMFKVGAELRSNFPYTAIFPEKIQNRFSESIWNTVDVQ